MTEKKKGLTELDQAKARIAELEVENERLKRDRAKRPAAKRMLTTSAILAPPLGRPRPNIMISTTQPRPHQLGGKPPMLQTHGLKLPELDAAEVLDRVKKARAADVQRKETKTK